MKKKIVLFLALLLVFTGCSSKEQDDKLVIGITPGPQEKITEVVKEELKKEGIELEIKVFTDYVQPNLALADGSLDANFFQHKPFMDLFVENNDAKIVSIGGVHIEPIAFYSDKIENIDDLAEGDEVLIPNDASNGARALLLLEKNGVIKLKEGLGTNITDRDIEKNEKNLKITPIDAALLTKNYKDVAGAVINSNFAINSGLNPLVDGLIIEDKDSIYANIIAVKDEDKEKEKIEKLMKAYNSDSVKDFIEKEYEGSILPAF